MALLGPSHCDHLRRRQDDDLLRLLPMDPPVIEGLASDLIESRRVLRHLDEDTIGDDHVGIRVPCIHLDCLSYSIFIVPSEYSEHGFESPLRQSVQEPFKNPVMHHRLCPRTSRTI